jgi:hypothetical protein
MGVVGVESNEPVAGNLDHRMGSLNGLLGRRQVGANEAINVTNLGH